MTPTPLPSAGPPRAAAAAPRRDIFAAVHRTLRLFMCDTLGRLGRLNVHCAGDVSDAGDRLAALLRLCRLHLEQQNRFVYPAIEARRPGATSQAAVQHAESLREIAALEADVATLRAGPTAPRAAQLYRHVALFVAASFEHMHVDETALNEALWAEYGNEQLLDLEQQLWAAADPGARAVLTHWMARALPAAQAGPEHAPTHRDGSWSIAARPMAPTGDVHSRPDGQTFAP